MRATTLIGRQRIVIGIYGDLAGPMEELEPGYRSHGSLHESDIPLIIYNSSIKLPPAETFSANLDLTRHIIV